MKAENPIPVKAPSVLLAAAECSPFSKTGGLADVAGALPKSLCALGIDTRVITPLHRCVKEKYGDKLSFICSFYVDLGWRRQYVGLHRLEHEGITVYFIDNEYYFGDAIYLGGEREGEQYAFFQTAVLESLGYLDFSPNILHCNDWHTAMLPFLIKTKYKDRPQGALKTVLTIHNLAFQGKFSYGFAADLFSLDGRYNTWEYLEHRGCANFMKAGLNFADKITTVSPNYAAEILTSQYGEGLEGVLSYRGGDLCGIVNGLDTTAFSPATDSFIKSNYDISKRGKKRKNKLSLMEEMCLDISPDTPIVAMVTRMTGQKGFDLVDAAMERLMERDCAFVLLGSGDKQYENAMSYFRDKYPGRIGIYLGYSEPLSRRIYAGADFLLMPSAFEPCGLSQLIAMAYGTLPIVRETGGLKDTVINLETGFSFAPYSAESMLSAIDTALAVYKDKEKLDKMMVSAMERDSSFNVSAKEYAALFRSLIFPGGKPFHDPFDESCRCPLGAVKCGDSVTLRLFFLGCDSATLHLEGESITAKSENGVFEFNITAPDTPCSLGYYFTAGDQSVGGFTMTVYDGAFKTPEWAKGAVVYQIFPDRFARGGDAAQKGLEYHRGLGRTMLYHESWEDAPKHLPSPGEEFYTPNDFFGGTLKGIEAELERLWEMGVDCLYLNPIFESCSNHRYDTADYLKPDPILGSHEDFRSLCEKAESLGMHIILDGVFSHTGADSVYFNKFGRYEALGAYQSAESPYYHWYDFREFPESYRSWWGFESLPEVNEMDESWQDFVISGENSVIKTWLRRGAGGWRLDVADEIPDEALEELRCAVKETDPDALIIGEVWEDATTKISYGKKRSYALGRALDSVMNYPLRRCAADFALGRLSAPELCRFLVSQKLSYPEPMYHCLLNLVGSHDTARIRSLLGHGHGGDGLSREQQAELRLDESQNAKARKLQTLCAAIQFALPGMPHIYYGDEEGMEGFSDPFCRAPYKKGDDIMRGEYTRLGLLRRGDENARKGSAAFFAPDDDTLCILRYLGKSCSLIAINRGKEEKRLALRGEDFLGESKKILSALPALPEIRVEAGSYTWQSIG